MPPTRTFPCKLDFTNPLAANLICLLAFNESPQWYMVNNLALSGNSGTEQANPMWWPICGYLPVWDNTPSLVFPGGGNTNNYIDTQGQLPMTEGGLVQTVPFTMVCSVWLNGTGQQALINRDTNGNGWDFYIDSSTRVAFFANRSGGNMSLNGSGSLSTGQWYQLAVTSDGSNTPAGFKFFVNGSQVTTNTVNNTGSNWITPGGIYTRIGGGNNQAVGALNGKMAYCAIYWNRQLSAAELVSLDAGLPIISAASATLLPQGGWLPRNGWTITADSNWDSTPNFLPFHLLNGGDLYPSTNGAFFASGSWSSANTAPPHYVVIDMQTAQTFNCFGYTRRSDFAAADGLPNQFDIYVSNDGVTFGSPIYTNNTGAFQANCVVYFPTQTARYVKFVGRQIMNGVGTWNAQNNMVLGEVRVGYTNFNGPEQVQYDFSNLQMPRSPQALPPALYNDLVSTTLSVAITSTGYQQVTPASMTGIKTGMSIYIDKEPVWVVSTSGSQFYALVKQLHGPGVAIKQSPTRLPFIGTLPWGAGNLTFGTGNQTPGPTYMSGILSTIIPGNNGLQRAYKVPSTGGGGGGGGGTNTTGVGQIFPTGYYF